MDSSLDLTAFVVRSENRVATLSALAERPMTRAEIQDERDIARATLSRILADFRRRDLATKQGHRFELTPLGERLAAELSSLLSAVDSMRALQTVVPWLPLEDLEGGIDDLASVEVTLPSQVDPMAPIKRAATVIDGVEHVRGFCYSVVHAPILAECRNVVERGYRFEGVIAADVLEVVASDPAVVDRLRALFEDDDAEIRVHEGDVEPQLILAGETTLLLATDDGGAVQGLVEIDDPAVHAWAVERFAAIRRDATPLDPDRVADLLTA